MLSQQARGGIIKSGGNRSRIVLRRLSRQGRVTELDQSSSYQGTAARTTSWSLTPSRTLGKRWDTFCRKKHATAYLWMLACQWCTGACGTTAVRSCWTAACCCCGPRCIWRTTATTVRDDTSRRGSAMGVLRSIGAQLLGLHVAMLLPTSSIDLLHICVFCQACNCGSTCYECTVAIRHLRMQAARPDCGALRAGDLPLWRRSAAAARLCACRGDVRGAVHASGTQHTPCAVWCAKQDTVHTP